MANPASLSLQDLMYEYYRAAVPATKEPGSTGDGTGIITKGAGGGGASNVAITSPLASGAVETQSWQNAQKVTTQSNSGTSTAPAANTNLAILPMGIGYWRVRAIVGFGGTAESTAVDNFKFLVASVNIQLPVANQANTQSTYEFFVNVTTGGNNCVIENNSAGSAGSVYKATIMIDQVA